MPAVKTLTKGTSRKKPSSDGEPIVGQSKETVPEQRNSASHNHGTGQKKVLSTDQLRRMREGRQGAQSTQSRCGLRFPVGILKRRMLKDKYAPRISMAASVWLAGALEALVLEVLDAVIVQTEECRKKCVTAQHVMAALRSDDEFQRIFKNVTIARGGNGGITTASRVMPVLPSSKSTTSVMNKNPSSNKKKLGKPDEDEMDDDVEQNQRDEDDESEDAQDGNDSDEGNQEEGEEDLDDEGDDNESVQDGEDD